MSLFDKMSEVAGLAGGAAAMGGGNAALLNGVLGMLGSNGAGGNGLASVLQAFEQQGLGRVAASWVGTGQNLPISTEQIIQGLGSGRLQQLAEAAGLPHGAAASALAGLLPTVIDRLTPNGSVPHGDQLSGLLGTLQSLLG